MEENENHREADAREVKKSDDDWRTELSAEQFRVLRQAGTEAPFGGAYRELKHQGIGTYHCAACGAELFSSQHKFDSGCGWPSFFDLSGAENIEIRRDTSGGMVRTEVRCRRCGSHLGHLFEGEGFPTPTDKRYCINAVAMEFVPSEH